MNTIMYAPWSNEVNDEAEEELISLRRFSILDIELSGECNFSCRYCDSPDRNKQLSIPLDIIKRIIRSEKIKYVFICGLGEPTIVGQNYDALIEILKSCVESKVQCSIFTNLHWITDELIEFIKNETLSVLFKLDSFDPTELVNLYGIPLEMAEGQLKNVQVLAKLIKNNSGYVNIAASIVPTRLNYRGIMNTISECLNIGIYPLLTDLGYSGSATAEYGALCLGANELKEIKSEISALIGAEYTLPVCPAVISGVHINHRGKVTVDSRSGLSCGWFWADEPMPFEIGDICTESIQIISKRILCFRREKSSSFVKATYENQIFGGCGGNTALLVERFKKIQQEMGYNHAVFRQ